MDLEAFSGPIEQVPVLKIGSNSSITVGYPATLWQLNGSGGAGSYPGSGSEACDGDTPGNLIPPSSVARRIMQANCVPGWTQNELVMLVDRLVHTAPITDLTTDPINVDTVPLPARAASGEGVMIVLERTTSTSIPDGTTLEIGYTDGDDNPASFQAVVTRAFGARSVMIITPPTPVKSIETIQFSATPSSLSLSVVLVKPVFVTISTPLTDQRHQPKGALSLMPATIPADACISAYQMHMFNTASRTPNLSMTLDLVNDT